MEFNANRRELALKVVYYGPALSGKTTNLQALHGLLDSDARGRLATLDTKGDRTLFFDLLPVNFRTRSGVLVKIKLFTVPGQVVHEATRKIVLQGTDGIVFVADSQRSATSDNNHSFQSMHKNLVAHRLDPKKVPTVIQFNKRDLPDIRGDDELAEIARRGKEPVFGAVAVRGQGVTETLRGLMGLLWQRLEREHQFSRKLGVSETEFMQSIFGGLESATGPNPNEAAAS